MLRTLLSNGQEDPRYTDYLHYFKKENKFKNDTEFNEANNHSLLPS